MYRNSVTLTSNLTEMLRRRKGHLVPISESFRQIPSVIQRVAGGAPKRACSSSAQTGYSLYPFTSK